MTKLLADPQGVEAALNRSGFAAVTAELQRAVSAAVELEDLSGYEVFMPLEAVDRFTRQVERLWGELGRIVRGDEVKDPDYWGRERQYARLERLRRHRFSEEDPLIWGLLLLHAEKVVHDKQLPAPQTPRVNRLAFGLGFLPDLGWGQGRFNLKLGLSLLAEKRYGAFPHTPATHLATGDTVSAFIDFYHAKLGRLKRVSLRRRIELIEMNQQAVEALDFLKTTGEVYRGWLMVGFAFLAPYALAPELVAAGGVATAAGLRAAAQAKEAATFVSTATEGSRAMLAIMQLGPSFFELAVTVGRIFLERPENQPLTPGEVFELLISGLGAIPSARLGYFLMGMAIAAPLEATQEFMAWLLQAGQALQERLTAAQADLELETFDSEHTFILELD